MSASATPSTAVSSDPSGSAAGLAVDHFSDDGRFPNSRLPLLVYRAALTPEACSPEALERLFETCGWPPAWRSSIFTYHHYHSTAHETLGVAAGRARLMLGGPQGRVFDVAAGDVIAIPAGVVHRRLESSGDFLVVGCYPPGQDWDLLRGEPGDREVALRNIPGVPLPATDPVTGGSAPLPQLWR
jgi:uncharacterized protein YjlB